MKTGGNDFNVTFSTLNLVAIFDLQLLQHFDYSYTKYV